MNAVAGRILILAPHPDDEIVACAIAASRAIAAGAGVFVLHLTTGVPPEHALWPWHRRSHREDVRRRREEALGVARLLGFKIAGFRDTRAMCIRPSATTSVSGTIPGSRNRSVSQ